MRLLSIGAGLCLLVLATYVVPQLSRFQPIRSGGDYVPFWNVVGREWRGEGRALEAEQAAFRALKEQAAAAPVPSSPGAARPEQTATRDLGPVFPPYPPAEGDGQVPEVTLEGVEALEHYYRRLTLVELGAPAVLARASHYGDSVLADDGLTAAIRNRLQSRFGDGGHGFHVLGRYNLGYQHRGIRFKDRGGWQRCQIIFKCERDGRYGFGGVSTTSSGGGTSYFATEKEGLGSRVSRFEVWYAKLPGGGDFQVKIDGEVARVFSTDAEETEDAIEVFEVPDGPHEFEVRAAGRGMVRGYGVVLERAGPGVVWDNLAQIGAFTQRLDYQDPQHIEGQVRSRDTDLLVFFLGGNDVQRETTDLYRTLEPYEEEYTRVIRKFKAGKKEASCLVMSVGDHGERHGTAIRSRRIMPKLVDSQRKVALAEGCAFFDTHAAMGGEGAIARWVRSKPALAGGDLGHLTSDGHEVLAALFYRALTHGYAEFRKKREGQPFPEWEALNPGAKGGTVSR